jgi:hypothetical protein
MFTYNPPDSHRPLTPSRVSHPLPLYVRALAEILPPNPAREGGGGRGEDDEADPALLRLPAVGLRGTWARAYALLTELVGRVGWDELLRIRSEVFVMEEEYRMQKAMGVVSLILIGFFYAGFFFEGSFFWMVESFVFSGI